VAPRVAQLSGRRQVHVVTAVAEHHAIVAACTLARDEAQPQVGHHGVDVALERAAEAAASWRHDGDEIAGIGAHHVDLAQLLLHRSARVEHAARGQARLAASGPQGLELEPLQAAAEDLRLVLQHADGVDHARAAAELAGPAAVGAQLILLYAHL